MCHLSHAHGQLEATAGTAACTAAAANLHELQNTFAQSTDLRHTYRIMLSYGMQNRCRDVGFRV